MRTLLLEEKSESLRRCLQRIRSKQPFSSSKLQEDFDLQDIVVLNLERATQLAVDVASILIADLNQGAPTTMASVFEILAGQKVISGETATRMKKAVGFRNIAVHEYERIDWMIVHSIVEDHLGDFSVFLEQVFKWVERNDKRR